MVGSIVSVDSERTRKRGPNEIEDKLGGWHVVMSQRIYKWVVSTLSA